MTGHRLGSWARAKRDDPVFWADVIQLVKTAAAAVIAWLIATRLFGLPQSFLAPWAALLVVHSTVYRTVSQGVRQVAAAVGGVLLAWAVGNVLGLDATAVSVVLLLGLLVGAFRWFGDERITVAATALIVLTTGFSDDDMVLLSRLADTGIGVLVGMVVNLLVWPPLHRRTTIAAMDALDNRIGRLLVDMADGLETGLSRGLIDDERWEGTFRDGYVAALRAAGHAIIEAAPEPISECHGQLDELAGRVERETSTRHLWPVYGGLLSNVRNMLDAMDEVAAANPMSQPPVPFRRARP